MIEWYIEQTLQELHIQKRYCGYRLLVLSTVLALEDENSLTEVESRIYKPVARQYHCKPSNVERNIRTVAKRTWEQFTDGLCQMARYDLTGPPSPSELIEMIMNHVQRTYLTPKAFF